MQQMCITEHLQNVKEQLQISESHSRTRPKMFLIPPTRGTQSCVHPPGSGGYKHTPSSARAPPAHAPLLGRGGCSSFGHTLQPMDAHTGKKHSLHPRGVPPWDTIIPPQLGDEGQGIC